MGLCIDEGQEMIPTDDIYECPRCGWMWPEPAPCPLCGHKPGDDAKPEGDDE